MVGIEIPYPKGCNECNLMRCGQCVAMCSKRVPEDGKPWWCPIKPMDETLRCVTESESTS